jgi:hypothetical protein
VFKVSSVVSSSFRNSVVCSALLMSFIGCTTVKTAPERGSDEIQTRAVLPVPSSRSGQGAGGILLVTDFSGRAAAGLADTPCRWRMIHKASGKSYFVNLARDNEATFSSMEPGHYQTGRLGCGVKKIWELDEVFKDGFTVEAGKVSYLGKLTFVFAGKDLKEIQKASRAESAQAFPAAVQAVPPGSGEVISGFTGRSLSTKMVDTDELRDGFDVFATGLKDASRELEPLLSKLQNCAKSEGVADPVRFGRLEYIAVFRNGRFSEMKDRRDVNAFSETLRSCVERGIMMFQSNSKSEFQLRVRY